MKQPENFSTQYKPQKNKQMPPKAKRIPHAMTLHGDTRIDNYYWLRDDDRSQAEVLDYLRQENEYGKKVMSSQSSLQDRVLKEIIDRIPQREVSAPYSKNGYRYRQVYEPGCEYAIYQRQPVVKEEWDEWDVLLDGNQRAAGSEFYTLGGLGVSPDNSLMAVAEDYLSRRQYSLRFFPLNDDRQFAEVLENVSPDFAWSNDSQTLWYVRKHPTTLLPYQVWRHRLGTPASADVLVYEEQDDTFYVSAHKTTSQQFVVIYLASATTSEVLLLNAEILILDDALSAVDGRTEHQILHNLRQWGDGRTIIISAHRLSALTEASEILVLQHGHIAQRGQHDALAEQPGWYRDMYRYQQLEAALDDAPEQDEEAANA